MTIRFWISSSVSEIFAAELRSRPKSGWILHVFRPWNFFGVCPPQILDHNIIKMGLLLTIVQNFAPVGPRISEISRCKINKKTSALKHKSFRKLSFSGGLIKAVHYGFYFSLVLSLCTFFIKTLKHFVQLCLNVYRRSESLMSNTCC